MMFVRLVALLLGDPPHDACLKYIWDHLLLPDLNDSKLVRGDVNVSLVEGKRERERGGERERERERSKQRKMKD